jgi:hypothetical protein
MNRIDFRIPSMVIITLCLFGFAGTNVAANDHCYTTGPTSELKTATWQPSLAAGLHEVYVWWAPGISETAFDAPYTINYDGGNQIFDVNQSINGGEWYLLGEFSFAAGISGNVQLSNDALGKVIADAVMFVNVDIGTEIIIDNSDVEFSLNGEWICEEGVSGAYSPWDYPTSIDEILAFFNNSVEEGSLTGLGRGRSASKRLNALRNMIETAGDLIGAGDIEGACGQLRAALRKCDGEHRPPDFAGGSGAEDLEGMLENLMVDIGCDAF